ncbi:protein AAR2 homolog [Argonauta hians]
MDQETAQLLFNEGSTLVFLDVPLSTEFGIDYNCWDVGPKFKGVKMIPPGVHFVYYSAKNKEGQVAPRTGFFHEFKPREIVLREWDPQTEDIKTEQNDPEVLERFLINKQELDQYLAPYPYENYKKWVSLTNHLSSDLLTSLHVEGVKICSVTAISSERSDSESRAAARLKNSQPLRDMSHQCQSMKEAESHLSQLQFDPHAGVQFHAVPPKYPAGATPAEVTKYSLDSSYAVSTMIDSCYGNRELLLLGEMQLAFVCFIVGQVYDGFEQWKKLVRVLSTAQRAVASYPNLYMQFIKVLHFQLKEIPKDFFVDILSQQNFLVDTLYELFWNLDSEEVTEELRKRGEKFKANLTETFQWDFTSEPDEYAPVVVESEGTQ